MQKALRTEGEHGISFVVQQRWEEWVCEDINRRSDDDLIL